MSLLFYDFNGSSTRLNTSSNKLADFIIHEEADENEKHHKTGKAQNEIKKEELL